MEYVSLTCISGLIVELRGMAAFQWALTKHLRSTNVRIHRYMSDVEAWAQSQVGRQISDVLQPSNEVRIQLGCEGIAKLLFFVHQDRIIVFWLNEFLREDADEDEAEFTVH